MSTEPSSGTCRWVLGGQTARRFACWTSSAGTLARLRLSEFVMARMQREVLGLRIFDCGAQAACVLHSVSTEGVTVGLKH